ncbi:PTS transporter subunit EIIC [Beduini massiliensis]|uniref:PTS transporter subunit EIIC n=1 Tax=Beduini massiliensis TaxID=1585974 RepID=UPI0006937CDC|nr:PTS transporter subunit EIIC [Beduini massiliensis]
MKLLVCCASGMSSSLLVQKMRDEVKKQQLNGIKIGSCSKDQLRKYIDEADVVLIAPQLHFFEQQIHDLAVDHDTRVINISMDDYGALNVENIINSALNDGNLHSEPIIEEEIELTKIESLQAKLYPLAKRVAANRSLNSISRAFITTMPVTVIGSMLTLIKNLPVAGYTNWLTMSGLSSILDLGSSASIDIISLYTVFFISYHLVVSYDLSGHGAGLISLACFFLITGRSDNGYSTRFLGANGLFAAIFIGLLCGYLYVFIIKRNWKIKLPSNIPHQVLSSFEAIIPSFIIISVCLSITALMKLTIYHDLHSMIYSTIQSNLMKFMGNNLFSFIFFQFVTNILWFFGLHGGNIVGAVTNPIYTPLSLENLAAFQAGDPMPNIINGQFGKLFIHGGVGSMLSLSILMLLFAKSQKYKAFGKLSFPTCLFFINEPLLFGVPIVLNPIFLIPLLMVTPILSVMTYFVTKIGLIPIATGAQVPWTTPPILYGFLQGSWRLALWEVITIVLASFLWYPFFAMADKQAFEEENNPCHN